MSRLNCMVLLVMLTSVTNAQNESIERKTVHALCAAANAILSTQMEQGILGDLIKGEARRHAEAARRWGASNSDLEQFIAAMTLAYNTGKMTWQEIADLGQECTAVQA